MGALRDALVRVADRTGVELATGCDVARIEASADRVRAVMTTDGDAAPPPTWSWPTSTPSTSTATSCRTAER